MELMQALASCFCCDSDFSGKHLRTLVRVIFLFFFDSNQNNHPKTDANLRPAERDRTLPNANIALNKNTFKLDYRNWKLPNGKAFTFFLQKKPPESSDG